MDAQIACPRDRPPWAAAYQVVVRLRELGFVAHFVGGCVRDLLLGRPVHDVDVATDARPDTVERAFPRTVAVGKSFGVVVVVESGQQVEVATFRADGEYRDGRHPSEVRFGDAQADAERRDFTINALFLDPADNRIVDHVGGLADLAAHTLRAVGDAGARLREDRLRVLRGLRFAAHLALAIEPATWQAMCAVPISGLSGERLMQEWTKALSASGRGRWLELLADSGRLAEFCAPVAAVTAVARLRIGESLDRLGGDEDPSVAQALFLGEADPAAVSAWLDAQPLPTDVVKRIAWLLAHGRDPRQIVAMAVAERRRVLRHAWADALVAFVAARAADRAAAARIAAWRQDERSSEWRPLLRANDLLDLGLPPGPRLGKLLRQLEDEDLAGLLSDRAAALARARSLITA